ncbi:hypothetical protein MTR67_003377 [Solanum verrucosum]|uniref:Uncharacterized protein n=1 Tax=Solanum verrucosum TaxID=315347 RepID=A0AAF0PSQ3_SOLVR|nr:hypothetical protein MTR67_003377 [Solanum verrucosum]
MARQRALTQIGSEGFSLIDEYFGKKRINRPPTTMPHNMSCNYRYNISPGSPVFEINIPSTRREAMITTPTPPVALNSYEAAQLHDGIYLANYSNKRQMRMAY